MNAVLEKFYELPDGWVSAPLEECAEILDSKRIPLNSKERSVRIDGKSKDELYPYYGATGQVGVIDDFIFEGEHLLIGEDGAPFFDKSKNVAYLVKGKFWVNNHAHILKALEGVSSNKYLLHYLNKFNYKDYVGGTTRLKLNQRDLKKIPVPLAPPEQQKRIVAKIEELFSHIDAGIEALKKAKQLLKQYRQSVLKAAVTGELTKEWREANKDKLEPATKLLERILKERRQKWEEQQLEQFKAKVKMPKDDKWKGKYKEPFGIEDNESLWLTMKVGEIFDCIVPNRDKPKSFTGEIAWVTTPVIKEKTASIAYESCELGLTEKEVKEYNARLVPENSVIMTCVGRFGITAVAERKCVINQQLHCFLPSNYFLPKLLAFFLQEKEKFMESIATATTVQYMNKTNCNSIPIPVMSLDEQVELLSEVEKRLSGIERLGNEVNVLLLKSEKNKQSILASAFSGKLAKEMI